jgi:RNA polymerase sigma-70 factor (ECF subfamily)
MDIDSHDKIINGCKRNERKYQEMFYKYYSPRLMGVAIRMAPDKDTAEDLLQDAFMKIFRSIKSVDKSIEPIIYTWSKRVLTNLIIDYHKKNQHKLVNSFGDMTDVLDEYEYVDNDTDDYLSIKNISPKMLHEAVASLSPKYKLVFNLHVVEGYIHTEISEMLGINVNTCKSNLRKAKIRLKKQLSLCS